jgi:hypothetical protein
MKVVPKQFLLGSINLVKNIVGIILVIPMMKG